MSLGQGPLATSDALLVVPAALTSGATLPASCWELDAVPVELASCGEQAASSIAATEAALSITGRL